MFKMVVAVFPFLKEAKIQNFLFKIGQAQKIFFCFFDMDKCWFFVFFYVYERAKSKDEKLASQL